MSKLIIVTFAFMGLAFYELSGGDAFVPIAEEKRAALEAIEAENKVLVAQARAEELAPTPAPVAQVILASARTSAPDAPDTPEIKTAEMIAAVNAALDADKVEEIVSPEPDAIAQPAPDIREVTAARVNMRNGPGQKFNVMGKLNGGDTVEILQDPGDGWVKLRVVENGRVGWMADFLLTASNN